MAAAVAHQGMPRGVLVGAAALILFSLASVGAVRLFGAPQSPTSLGEVVVSRDLRFADLPDGGVGVYDGGDGREVLIVPPGSDGFMRATMRGLARERRIHGVGAEPPFRLSFSRDGRLNLSDPTTGHLVALDAFGHTNAAAFARLLTAGPKSP